eukprot:TRINITY_DN13571_c0_g1_i2.p1 TRINITY_DN13571_c0_g1~~TRINITY_DN13571_c0_g1_i2.p1  ORF type:complete len:467 (-),score=75.59 TRINITY_DN13571_c0_g1_i2:643-1875(-)
MSDVPSDTNVDELGIEDALVGDAECFADRSCALNALQVHASHLGQHPSASALQKMKESAGWESLTSVQAEVESLSKKFDAFQTLMTYTVGPLKKQVDQMQTKLDELQLGGFKRHSSWSWKKEPATWLRALDFNKDANVWINRGTEGGQFSDVVRSGALTLHQAFAGKGAKKPLPALEGDMATKLQWKQLVPFSSFTMCSLTRYNSGKPEEESSNRRILTAAPNWLLGHWDNKAGVIYTEGWKSEKTNRLSSNQNWLAFCARTGGGSDGVRMVDSNYDIINVGNGEGASAPTKGGDVFVNQGGCCPGEKSNFMISELLVWRDDNIEEGVFYLRNLLQGSGQEQLGGFKRHSLRSWKKEPATWLRAIDFDKDANVWINEGTEGGQFKDVVRSGALTLHQAFAGKGPRNHFRR